MKESVNIQELFARASQEPVLTSFEETKQAFLKSAPGGNGLGKAGFSGKNWIIMLSSFLTTAIVATILLVPTDRKEVQEPAKRPKTSSVTADTDLGNEEENTEVNTPKKKRNTAITFNEKLAPKPLEIDRKKVLQKLTFHPLKPKSHFVPKEIYRFPILTEDDKKENEKRKRLMVKALLKPDKNAYAYVPSATVKIDSESVSIQAFYIQKHEVTNIQYKTFLFDLLIQGRHDDFMKAKPDQEQWVVQYGEGMRSMTDNYFSQDAYDEYPVVNVSREGAEMYCKWLTGAVNSYNSEKGNPMINDLRLPQRNEWIYAANGGIDSLVYPWESDSITNEASCYLANHKPESGKYGDDGGFHTVKVSSYVPNTFGLYCMSGNAAEMVYDAKNGSLVAGTAGGSWNSSAEELKIKAADPYSGITEGHPEIGFRVVSTLLRTE